MCGICGVYNFSDSSADKHTLNKMLVKMLHRGPDDGGIYQSGPVGLGMRRLAIIDTLGGNQPISNEDGSIWVICNGEIYNYIELRETLEKKGHRFKTESDTEILVHLYEQEGVEGIKQLNGMFAFALYDNKKQALWIARDRLGIKPLFYSNQSNALFFSSDLTALNTVIQSQNINIDAFISYLAFSYVPESKTIYKNIKKLLPGHWLWVDKQGIKTNQYWDVNHFQNWQGVAEEAQEQLYELLDSAVKFQLRSDVPIGISLSGGMDSSAISVFAKKNLEHITTFTIDFVGKTSQDKHYSQVLAKTLGTSHVEIPFYSKDVERHLDDLIPYIDEPLSDSAAISSYLVAKEAQKSGIKVLLTGAGGDEIFGGYHRHHAPRVASTQWLAEKTPQALMYLISPLIKLINKDKSLRMLNPKIAFGAGFSGANLAVLADLFKEGSSFRKLLKLFTVELRNIDSNTSNNSYSYNRMYTDLKHYLVSDVLSLADKTTMASSVEGRVPLLDHRLVEFAFSLPESVNFLQKKAKGLFCQTLSPLLPNGFLHRKKEGFNAPMFTWAKNENFSNVISNELLIDTIPLFKEIFHTEKMAKWVNRVKKGHIASETIFNLYFFSRWYRYHMEI